MSSKARQSTPQQAIAGFKSAAIRGAWKEAFEYLAPRAKKALVGVLCMEAAYAVGDETARDRLNEIMHRCGLRKDETRQWQDKELLSVLHDLLAWFERYAPADKKVNLGKSMADTEFSEFRISGDNAYAKSVHKGRPSEQRFKRTEGRWYLA